MLFLITVISLSKEAMVRNRAGLSELSKAQLLPREGGHGEAGGRVERSGGREKEVNIVLTTWKSLNNNLHWILAVEKKRHVFINIKIYIFNSDHFNPV